MLLFFFKLAATVLVGSMFLFLFFVNNREGGCLFRLIAWGGTLLFFCPRYEGAAAFELDVWVARSLHDVAICPELEHFC